MILLRDKVNQLYLIIGVVFVAYNFVTYLWLFQISSAHYTTFVLGIVILACLLAIRQVIDNREKMGPIIFWSKLILVWLSLILGLISAIYMRAESSRLEQVAPFIEQSDIVIGFLFICVMMILSWVMWGGVITGIIGAMILYFFWGHHLPGPIGHYKLEADVAMSFAGMDLIHGSFWFARLAEKVLPLFFFGSFIIMMGNIPLFNEIGKILGNRVKGGAAFPAIIGSAAVASVMGQAVSNVAITGQATIPMMKKKGFTPEYAATIETLASLGGQITPPILGLAGFIIANFLNVSYGYVMLASFIPAILYYLILAIGILTASNSYGLNIFREKIEIKTILTLLPQFIIPFGIVFIMLMKYYSTGLTSLIALGALFLLFSIRTKFRLPWKDIFSAYKSAMELATQLCMLALPVGIFAQAVITSNLGSGIYNLFGGTIFAEYLILALLLTAVVCLILGMGMPTPLAYVITVLTAGVILKQIGLESIRVHFFCLYFAVFSAITPPIALGVMAACKIAHSAFWQTCFESFKLALVTFLLPFAFVYHPSILKFPQVNIETLLVAFTLIALAYVSSASIYGHKLAWSAKLSTIQRVVFGVTGLIGSIYIFFPAAIKVCILFFALVALVTFWPAKKRKEKIVTQGHMA